MKRIPIFLLSLILVSSVFLAVSHATLFKTVQPRTQSFQNLCYIDLALNQEQEAALTWWDQKSAYTDGTPSVFTDPYCCTVSPTLSQQRLDCLEKNQKILFGYRTEQINLVQWLIAPIADAKLCQIPVPIHTSCMLNTGDNSLQQQIEGYINNFKCEISYAKVDAESIASIVNKLASIGCEKQQSEPK